MKELINMETETIEVYTFSIREKRAKEKYSFADGFDLYEKMKRILSISYIIVKQVIYQQKREL